MSRFALMTLILLAGGTATADEAATGFDTKYGLSLTVRLEKQQFDAKEEIRLEFTLKNSGQECYVSDGYLAPDDHEAGPGRHFEVRVAVRGGNPLYFWSRASTEGSTAGVRRVFRLKPGETYSGSIVLRGKEGGSFEDMKTRRRHNLGAANEYFVQLLYQVHDSTHGVFEPPKEFNDSLLWRGCLISNPILIRVGAGKE